MPLARNLPSPMSPTNKRIASPGATPSARSTIVRPTRTAPAPRCGFHPGWSRMTCGIRAARRRARRRWTIARSCPDTRRPSPRLRAAGRGQLHRPPQARGLLSLSRPRWRAILGETDMDPWKMAGIAAVAAAAVIVGIQAYASSAALDQQDRLFMEAATRAGLFELRSGELALQRAARSEVREYARAVRADQAHARASLLALAADKSRSVPTAVGAEQHAVLGELQNAGPGEFDELYLTKVALEGQAAVLRLYKRTVRHSKDPQIQAYAASVVPMLQSHLEKARELQGMQYWQADSPMLAAVESGQP